MSRPQKFWLALEQENPLQIVGTVNAYSALLAEQQGFRCIYLSGSGVAAASYGIPDLGITSLDNVLEDARRITSVSTLPLLVDIDTGWGNEFNIARTIRELERAEVAAVHIEDQVATKRCGHRPNKEIVSTSEMCNRIRAAVDARTDSNFVIMARTDALASEGIEAVVERVQSYVEAGANAIFAEAMTEQELYRKVTDAVSVPVLANLTEFGKTPLFTLDQMASVGVQIALYPLSAFRAMSEAAMDMYRTIRTEGTQNSAVCKMQTREELYRILGYHEFEKKIDELSS
ncbi:MAG: methylisocitrate lyase [Gammaproteobacteria bacterium]|nr:methylisocitrate lyase [Gammaproteobacteria bacterium]MYF39109.1 methylisocitrate lyase [Gammaproteobacteria bacterium]